MFPYEMHDIPAILLTFLAYYLVLNYLVRTKQACECARQSKILDHLLYTYVVIILTGTAAMLCNLYHNASVQTPNAYMPWIILLALLYMVLFVVFMRRVLQANCECAKTWEFWAQSVWFVFQLTTSILYVVAAMMLLVAIVVVTSRRHHLQVKTSD